MLLQNHLPAAHLPFHIHSKEKVKDKLLFFSFLINMKINYNDNNECISAENTHVKP